MRLMAPISLSIALIMLPAWLTALETQPAVNTPGDDYDFTLSPDGKWIVYTSNEDGVPRLYKTQVKDLQLGMQERVIQGPGRSFSPAFSPDGKVLTFVSSRDDAFGDVLYMPFPSGNPVNIGTLGLVEMNPSFSDDGKSIIYTHRRVNEHKDQTMRYDLASRSLENTDAESISSAPFPIVEADPTMTYALLQSDDTNKDQRIDKEDHASLWNRKGETWYQVTAPIRSAVNLAYSPVMDKVYISARWLDALDIHEILQFDMDATLSGEQLLAAAMETSSLEKRIAYLREASRRSESDSTGNKALSNLLDAYLKSRRYYEATKLSPALEPNADLPTHTRLERARYELLLTKGEREKAVELLDQLQETIRASNEDTAVPLYQVAEMSLSVARYADALAITDEILSGNPTEQLTANSLLLRLRTYRNAGLTAELTNPIIKLFQATSNTDFYEEASDLLIESVLTASPETSSQLVEIRAVGERLTSIEWVSIRLKMKEAKLLASLGERNAAIALLSTFLESKEITSKPGADAVRLLADLQADNNDFETALSTLRQHKLLLDKYPDASDRSVSQRVNDYFIREGNQELRLNDPLLALRTFERLLEVDPENYQAWRGAIQAESSNTDLLKQRLHVYRDAYRQNKESALDHYKLGLALSYEDPLSKKALHHVQRAKVIDPSTPYPYLTEGFLLEQQYRKGLERGKKSSELIEKALISYRRATAIATRDQNQLLKADLLTNSANAEYLSERFARAERLFQRRLQTNIEFPYIQTEFLHYYHMGIAAYRSSSPMVAERAFKVALPLLQEMAKRKVLETSQVSDLERELQGRLALVYLDQARYQEAFTIFEILANQSEENSLALARSYRNMAISLFLLERSNTQNLDIDMLHRSIDHANQALKLLQSKNLKGDPSDRPSGALLSFGFDMTSAESGGGAALGFDIETEERLVYGVMSRLYETLGDPDKAKEMLLKQRETAPLETELNIAYERSVDSVLISRLINSDRRAAAGQKNSSTMTDALVGLERARFLLADELMFDPLAIAHHYLNAAELLQPETVYTQKQFWMIPTSSFMESAPIEETMYRAGEELLKLEDPLYPGIPVLSSDTLRARIHLGMMLVAAKRWKQLLEEGNSNPSIESLRTIANAEQWKDKALNSVAQLTSLSEITTAPEIRRLTVLAKGIELQLHAPYLGAEELKQACIDIQKWSDDRGFSAYGWMPFALGGLHGQEAHTAEMLSLALTAMEDSITLSTPFHRESLLTFLEAMESRHHEALSRTSDWVELWNVTDRYQSLRIRIWNEEEEFTSSIPEEVQWIAKYRELVREYEEINLLLQFTAEDLQATRSRFLSSREATETKLRQHIDTGHQLNFNILHQLRPTSISYEEFAQILEPPFVYTPKPKLYLQTKGRSSQLLTGDGNGLQPIDTIDTQEEATILLVGATPKIDLSGQQVIRLINGWSFLRGLEQISFKGQGNQLVFSSSIDQSAWNQTAPLAREWVIEDQVKPNLLPPSFWSIGDSIYTLGQVLSPARDLDQITWSLRKEAPSELGLPLSAISERHTAQSTIINGNVWNAPLLSPEQAPQLAAEELNLSQDAIVRLLNQGKNSESVLTLEKIVYLMESLGPDRIDRYQNDPDLYNDERSLYLQKLAEIAAVARDVSRTNSALDKWLTLVEERAGSKSQEYAESLQWGAARLSTARDYENALRLYDEALSIYDALQLDSEITKALTNKGIVLELAGYYPKAWEVGQELSDRYHGQITDESIKLEIRLARIARLYLNRYQEAEELLLSARANSEQIENDSLLRESLVNLARVYHSTGNFDAAMEELNQLAYLATEAGDNLKLAEIALERGNVHWYRSEYFDAFQNQRNATSSAQQLSNLPLEIAGLNTGGLISWSVNDYPRALDFLGEAYDLAEDLAVPSEIASTSNNIGIVYRSAGDYEKALEWLRKAERIDKSENNRWGQAYSFRNIALTYIAMGEANRAIQPLDRAIELTRQIGDEINLAKSLLGRGDASIEMNELDVARANYLEALQYAASLPLPEVAWRCLYGLAKIEERKGTPRSAVEYYTQAIDIVDALRASIRIEEFQNGFLIDKQDLYNSAIKLQLDLDQPDLALEISEKARGRNFIDLLGNRSINLGSSLDEEKLAAEKTLRRTVESLERQLHNASSDQRSSLTEQLERARRDYADFLIQLRVDNPQLSQFVRVDPISLTDIQALLTDDVALLVYHVLPDETAIFVLKSDSLTLHRIPLGEEPLAKAIQSVRIALQNFEPVADDLYKLSQSLIAPVLNDLSDIKHVGIVPHRELHNLPFAAVPINPAEAMVDRFALFYTPSMSVLRYTVERRRELTDEVNVLAIGNPFLGSHLYDLPFAEKEASRIRYDFKNVTLRTGSEATEGWTENNIKNFGIVHIASHGEYDANNPLFSGILLAPDDENDGRLSAEDVFSLQLTADLVALSACQTGLGRVTTGDDIIGLSRSFVYAGTRQLITTLWRVDDVSTALLFKYFYRNDALYDRSEALRQAQLRLKSREEYSHPAHWASVVLTGDWK